MNLVYSISIYIKQSLITFFAIISIVTVSFLAYSDVLDYFFTGMDAIPLIDSSRIQSPGDIVRIFTEPGMNAIPDAVNYHKWYRPVSVLSYSMDYSIWGLNPFGYHLTDIILHVLVSVLVFFLIRLLTNGKQVVAWLGAVIFTTHPLLVEVVPANVRRMDTLATVFVLLSILLFLKYFSAVNHRRCYLYLSVFLYAIAIGAKEIAIIELILVFAYSVMYDSSDDKSVRSRLVKASKSSGLYLAVSLVYLVSRIVILDGIGGYANGSRDILQVFQILIEICTDYFIFLMYPVDFLHLQSLFSTFQAMLTRVFIIITLSMIFFAGIHQRRNFNRYFADSAYNKTIIFFGVWLLLPLGVYLLTLISGRYYLYISVVPFSAILAIIIVEGFRSSVKKIKKSRLINCSVIIFLMVSGLAGSLLVYSPLIRSHSEWKNSGEISRNVFHEITETVSELQVNTGINVYNFPDGIPPHKAQIYHAKEVEYPADYSIKSWLDLVYPDINMEVIVRSRSSITVNPDDLYLEMEKQGDGSVVIIIKYGK